MKRILIIGSGGAGKSTLARTLAQKLGLPLTYLDRMYWKPGWVGSDQADFERRLTKLLRTKRWIIEGNYSRTLSLRLRYADTVIFLDYGRWICLRRALWRVVKGLCWRRPDLAEGCSERLNFEFLAWIWNFQERIKPDIFEKLKKGPKGANLLVFKRPSEAEAFLGPGLGR